MTYGVEFGIKPEVLPTVLRSLRGKGRRIDAVVSVAFEKSERVGPDVVPGRIAVAAFDVYWAEHDTDTRREFETKNVVEAARRASLAKDLEAALRTQIQELTSRNDELLLQLIRAGGKVRELEQCRIDLASARKQHAGDDSRDLLTGPPSSIKAPRAGSRWWNRHEEQWYESDGTNWQTIPLGRFEDGRSDGGPRIEDEDDRRPGG